MNQLTTLIALLSILIPSEAFSPLASIRTTGSQSLAAELNNRSWTTVPLYSSSNDNIDETDDNTEQAADEIVEGSEDIVAQEGESKEEDKPASFIGELQEMSKSFTEEPIRQQRLDPLVASLTRMDADMINTPTTKVPLLGEIPLDGSIVVLIPVALIAIVGFIMSINIAMNSQDLISEKIDEINAVLSAPPVKQTVVNEGCRGLCSDQDQQLDNMRGFMNSLAPK